MSGLTPAATLTLAALAAAAISPAAVARPTAIRTPGYRGTTVAPRTLPAKATLPKPIELAAEGREPQVLVDDAGTAHIVWVEDRGNDADVIRYCRIRRGGTGCETTSELVPAQDYTNGNGPDGNAEYSAPRIVSIGDGLAVVSNRYPNRIAAPDGNVHHFNTYLFLSSNGGGSFDPGVLVGTGELSGQPAVFGSGDAARIGLISDTATGGPYFQAISAGRYTSSEVSFGGDGLDSSVAATGTTVMVAYQSIAGTTYVKTWSGNGEISDPGTWSTATLSDADRPRLTSGPAGVYMISEAGSRDYYVRKVTPPGTFGRRVKVSDTRNANMRDLFEDGSGRLVATYADGNVDGLLVARTSTDGGRTWTPRAPLVRSPSNAGFYRTDVATAADGGGFALSEFTPVTTGGRIVAAPLGPQSPTGKPGLGSLPGGGDEDASVVESCQKVSFAAVDVVAPEGCLLGVAGRPGVRVSEGTIRLNGLELVPEGNTKILLNARERTINTTGRVTVQLRAPGVAPVVLAHRELHLRLPGGAGAAAAAASSAPARGGGGDGPTARAAADECSDDNLMEFNGDASGSVLKGFPIKGTVDVYISEDSVCIPVSLELPKAFGGIRGDAVLRADNSRGLHLDSLEIRASTIQVGVVLVEDLDVSYRASGDEWNGGVTLSFPPGWTMGATAHFKGGSFRGATITAGYWPGVPVFSGVFLNRIGGGFDTDPLRVTADARFGAIPTSPPKGFVIAVDGHLELLFGDPFQITVSGVGSIFDIQLVKAHALANSDLYFETKAEVSLDVSIAAVQGSIEAAVDAPAGRWNAAIGGSFSVVGYELAKASAVLSNRGLGACGEAHIPIADVTIDAGFGHEWDDGFDLLWGSCDLTAYRVVVRAAGAGEGDVARSAQAGGGFSIARGTRLTSVRVSGAGAPPAVVLVSPSGERIEPAMASGGGGSAKGLGVAVPSESATYVALPRPAAGSWHVEAAPGSSAITQVAAATALPAPKVTARVSAASSAHGRRGHAGRRGGAAGRARARTLAWRFSNAERRTLTFWESGRAGESYIGRASGAHGTLRFNAAEGPAGRRTIFATVEQDGLPRHRFAVTRYRAPAPSRPARVARLRARRAGNGVAVSWRGGGGATGFLVRASVSDGRRVGYLTRRRSFRVPAIAGTDRVTVIVRGRGASGRVGPAARVALRPARRRAAR
ncbi:MAG TPA: hypothetical protein VGM91_13795 [Conexibacter sp.]|jgi:hypothetical protein